MFLEHEVHSLADQSGGSSASRGNHGAKKRFLALTHRAVKSLGARQLQGSKVDPLNSKTVPYIPRYIRSEAYLAT